MDKAFEVNEKLMIISIIIGFVFGIYLAVGHDNPDLWFIIVQWIFLLTIIMTLISTISGLYGKDSKNPSITDVLRIFALNFAVIAVCTSFGFVFGSFLIGNYNTAN